MTNTRLDHQHRYTRAIAIKVRTLTMRCASCSKTTKVQGDPCPECGPKAAAYVEARRSEAAAWTLAAPGEERNAILAAAVPQYTPGCERCYRGFVPKRRTAAACCCSATGYTDRCENCKRESDTAERTGHDQVHVCTVESDDEKEQAIAQAFMSPVSKVQPDPERDRLVAAMEERSRN